MMSHVQQRPKDKLEKISLLITCPGRHTQHASRGHMGRSKKGTVSVSTGPGTHAFIRVCGWNVSGVPGLRLVWPIQTKRLEVW